MRAQLNKGAVPYDIDIHALAGLIKVGVTQFIILLKSLLVLSCSLFSCFLGRISSWRNVF